MGDIITPGQLSSRMQDDALDMATVVDAITVVENDIRRAVGPDRYDALADKTPLMGVALTVATRIVGNPEALKSSRIDDSADGHSETSLYLTKDEVRRCRRAAGRPGGGAFSIAPSPPPAHVCTDLCRHDPAYLHDPVCLL